MNQEIEQVGVLDRKERQQLVLGCDDPLEEESSRDKHWRSDPIGWSKPQA